jgi:hypothetical protein
MAGRHGPEDVKHAVDQIWDALNGIAKPKPLTKWVMGMFAAAAITGFLRSISF